MILTVTLTIPKTKVQRIQWYSIFESYDLLQHMKKPITNQEDTLDLVVSKVVGISPAADRDLSLSDIAFSLC